MFYSICFLVQREISEMRRPIGVKFCTMIPSRPKFVMPVQNFGSPSQKNLGPKTCKILPDFGWLQTSAANKAFTINIEVVGSTPVGSLPSSHYLDGWLTDCGQVNHLGTCILTNFKVNSAFRLSSVDKSSISVWLGLKRGAFTCVGGMRWQITVCDLIWQVTILCDGFPVKSHAPSIPLLFTNNVDLYAQVWVEPSASNTPLRLHLPFPNISSCSNSRVGMKGR